jgi:succinate dehydrogenase/fumarate reductase cytochrome b subunit
MNSFINSPAQRTAQTQDIASRTENVRNAELRATRIHTAHRFAGMTLAVFIAMHLTNHLCALFSIEQHLAIMDMLRLVYRNPLGEVILLGAVLVQVPSGILLVKRKGWRGLPLAEWAQVASGGYLAFFLVAHVFAVMMGRYFFHLDTNFYYASAVLFSPLWLYYVVYYGLSVIAVFTHIGSIHYQKMLLRTSSERAQIQAMMIVGVGLTVAVLILLAFSGVLYEIKLPA